MKTPKRYWRTAFAAVATVAVLAAAVQVVAQPMGMGMGRMSAATRSDPAAAADLGLVHQMLAGHQSIKRSVTRLADGIRTVTESDDPQVVQALKAHVASMEKRLQDGREFNLFSKTIPVLFQHRDKIVTRVETTATGVVMRQTSADPVVVAALHAHADEVSELARDGMVAMMRGMHGGATMQGAGMHGGAMTMMGAGMHGGAMTMMGGGMHRGQGPGHGMMH